mgnify:CR=1 FL=1
MALESVSTWTGSYNVAYVNTGTDIISAATFQSMLNVLNELANHNHIFYDDYTTVCDCQCDCACSRGTL